LIASGLERLELTTLTYVLWYGGWVESIGVANENAAFAMLVGLAKRFEDNEASFSTTSTD
jgi:hypothetical protein